MVKVREDRYLGPFNLNNRQYQDVWMAVVYLTLLVLAWAVGIYAFSNRNKDMELVWKDNFKDGRACNVGQGEAGAGSLVAKSSQPRPDVEIDFSWRALAWLAGTVAVALLLGIAFVYSFKRAAGAIVKGMIGVQLLAPLVGAIALFSIGETGAGVALLVLFALTALLVYLVRHKIELVIRLFTTAGVFLSHQPVLIPLTLAFEVVMILFLAPLVMGLFFAYFNGEIVANDFATKVRTAPGQEGYTCFDQEGQEVLCCAWEVEEWAEFYLALGSVMVLWTTKLFFDLRLFTTAGSVQQWYYTPPDEPVSGNVGRSLGLSLTKSFGSICLSSLVMTVIEIIKRTARAQQARSDNFFVQCCMWVLQCLLRVLEFLSRFSVIHIAATGQPFFRGAREVTSMLKRNSFEAVTVWWLPEMVLDLAAFLVALVWGVASGFIAFGALSLSTGGAALLGAVTTFFTLVTLQYFTSLIHSVVDAVFWCYMSDRDTGEVHSQQVHLIYDALPTTKSSPPPSKEQCPIAFGGPAPDPRSVPIVDQEHGNLYSPRHSPSTSDHAPPQQRQAQAEWIYTYDAYGRPYWFHVPTSQWYPVNH